MTTLWKLDDEGTPVPCRDPIEWSKWFETTMDGSRHLGDTRVGRYRVSTIFLAVDHNWYGTGPPILWETMVFTRKGRTFEDYERRYSSRDAALDGHKWTVRAVKRMVSRP